MTEEELAQQIRAYQELKKDNKDIDLAALALATLQNHEANMLTAKEKRIGYLVSLALPPLGLGYALKFYFSGKSDGKQAAYMCIGITVVTGIMFLILSKLMFAGSGADIQQIKQIKPQDIQELLQ